MKSKIILLNGGKGCGKTVAVEYLRGKYDLVKAECKENLFDLTIKLFNLTPDEFYNIYENRDIKEVPQDCFLIDWVDACRLHRIIKDESLAVRIDEAVGTPQKVKLSVREALIFVSEVVVKPVFSEDYFGKARANKIRSSESWFKEHLNEVAQENKTNLFIDDSAGFPLELPPLIEYLGQENIILIRIKGRGNFDGDSRSFIPDGVITNTVDIYNTDTEAQFLVKIETLVEAFINE